MNKKISFLTILTASLLIILSICPGIKAQRTTKMMDNTFLYEDLSSKLDGSLDAYKKAEAEFKQSLESFQQQKGRQEQEKLEKASKNLIVSALNSLKTKNRAMKAWVNSVENLSNSRKMELTSRLSASVKSLDQTINAAEKSDSLDEIKESARKTAALWRSDRAGAKKTIGKILAFRMEYLAGKAKAFSEKCRTRDDILQEEENIRPLIEKLEKKAELMKKNTDQALESFNKIKTGENAPETAELNNLFNQGYASLAKNDQEIKVLQNNIKAIENKMSAAFDRKTIWHHIKKRLKLAASTSCDRF